MTHIVRVDAEGKKQVLEAIRRYNAECKRIEDESAARTGKPLDPVAVRMIAVPASDEIAAQVELEAEEDGPLTPEGRTASAVVLRSRRWTDSTGEHSRRIP